MKKFLVICSGLVILGVCACSKPIIGPDGTEYYSARCDGWAMSWDDCLGKAGVLRQPRLHNQISDPEGRRMDSDHACKMRPGAIA